MIWISVSVSCLRSTKLLTPDEQVYMPVGRRVVSNLPRKFFSETIMIIQCDNCNTRFRLDDSKITESGVRVRCSRCSHTFIVRKEPPADGDTFDTLLAGFGAPSAADEAPEPSENTDGNDTASHPDEQGAASGKPAESAGGSVSDAAGQEAEPAAETAAPADPFAGFLHKGISLPQFEVKEPSSEHAAEKPEAGVSEVPEQPVSGQEAEPATEAEAQSEPFAGFFRKGVPLPQFRTGEAAAGPGEEASPAGGYTADAESEESPASEPLAEEHEAASPANDGTGLPRGDEWGILAETKAAPEDERADAIREQRVMADEDHDLPPLSIASRRQSSPAPFLLLGGVLMLIVALIASVFFFKWPVDPAAVMPPSLMKMAGSACTTGNGAEIRSLDGAYLVNREAGELFAITGEVANTSGRAMTALRVKGTVYDGAGQVLAQRTVYCGNTLSREQLAGLPFAELEKAMGRQFGDSLANLDVAPGKTIPFVVVFKGVPGGGAKFGAVVVDGQGVEPVKR